MPPSADELIQSGEYDLKIDADAGVDVGIGERFSYNIIQGGTVQADKTVPVTIRISSPPRLAGKVAKATLVPAELSLARGKTRLKSKDLMKDIGWFGKVPKAEA